MMRAPMFRLFERSCDDRKNLRCLKVDRCFATKCFHVENKMHQEWGTEQLKKKVG